MANKSALVLDTNMLFRSIASVTALFGADYDIMITEVSRLERLSQIEDEIRKAYRTAKQMTGKFPDLFAIDSMAPSEDAYFEAQKPTREKEFDNFIVIPQSTHIIESDVLGRALRHTPPFSKESDKGYKDTLIWLCIIDYFAQNPAYENIYFISMDSDFLSMHSTLEQEFESRNGKKISIQKDYPRKDLSGCKAEAISPKAIYRDNDVEWYERLKKEINETIDGLCFVETSDSFERSFITRSFMLSDKATNSQVEMLLSAIGDYIEENEFANEFDMGEVLSLANIETVKSEMVAFDHFDRFAQLTAQIYDEHPDHYRAYVNLVRQKLNRNYELLLDSDLVF